MVEVIRKNQLVTDFSDDFIEFNNSDFNQQQTLMKNDLSKKYVIKIISSFNERSIFAVVGKDANDNYFYAIDKNYKSDISSENLKSLL